MFPQRPSGALEVGQRARHMQHSYIGFYYDIWSICLCLAAGAASLFAVCALSGYQCAKWPASVTFAYASVVFCCVCSFLLTMRMARDHGNMLLLLGGLAVYGARCHSAMCARATARFVFVSAGVVTIVCHSCKGTALTTVQNSFPKNMVGLHIGRIGFDNL
jgi:hypothetical protein